MKEMGCFFPTSKGSINVSATPTIVNQIMYSNLRHNTEASLSQANGSLMERGAERGEGVPDARTPRKGSRHASSLSARQIYKRSEALT